jgi:hypothetical protein
MSLEMLFLGMVVACVAGILFPSWFEKLAGM